MLSKCAFAVLLMFTGMVLHASAQTQTQIISSPVFIFASGFSPAGWSTTETVNINTPMTQENFKLEVVMGGAGYTSWGPTFPDGIITTSGSGQYVADPASFTATVKGSYLGSLNPSPDSYRLKIEIQSISMWGSINAGVNPADGTLFFRETTSGHTKNQSSQTIYYRNGNYYFYSWAFNKVVWGPCNPIDPDGWWSTWTSTSLPITRTFGLTASNNIVIDGFEIVGRIYLEHTSN